MEDIELEKIEFKDLPDTTTPVTASKLNEMQDNVEVALNEVNDNIENATKTTLTTTSGKNQEITNCAGASGKLNIESGETEQDGEPTPTNPVNIISVGSNINLFNENQYLENYTITSGAIASGSENNNLYYIPVKYGKNYVINFEGDLSTNCIYGYCDTTPANGVSATSNVSTINNLKTLILTPPSSSNKYLLLRLNRVTQFPNMSKIKIEEGEVATGYTKYGCGSIDYKVRNRNLLVLKDGTYTSGNLTAKVENGKVTLNGTNGSSTNFIEIPLEFDAELELGKQYAISINNPTTAGDTTNYGAFRIDSVGIVDLKFSTINNRRKITINDDIFSHLYTKTLIRIRTAANLSYNNFVIYPQIEEGDTYSDYQEGRKEIVTIPLPQGMELCKIGTYKDYLYKANGKWYKHKEIGKAVLDGTETISVTNTGTSYWYYNIIKATGIITNSDPNRNNAVCDNYLIVSINSSSDYQGIFILKSGSIRIRYGTEDTAENFKTWLGTHNVTIYYVLETPVEEEITDKDTIYYLEHFPIYQEYTNVECINEVKPDMHIDYLYDNEVNNYWGAELDSLAEKLHNLEVGE